MKTEKMKCPSCGGGGSNGITGDCSRCGGSGEVEEKKPSVGGEPKTERMTCDFDKDKICIAPLSPCKDCEYEVDVDCPYFRRGLCKVPSLEFGTTPCSLKPKERVKCTFFKDAAEREAVAAGYKKVSLPDSGRCPNCGHFGHMVLECPALSSNFFKEKVKPSEAEVRVKAYADGFKAGWDALERKIRNIDLEPLMFDYGKDTGIPLNAYERAQIRSVFKRVLRGLLEEKK